MIDLESRPLSFSSLKEFKKSPQHYMHYLTAPRTQTPALLFGSLFDCMLLTPGDVDKRFAIAPELDKRTKDGKEKWETFCKENEGKTFVRFDEHEKASAMIKKVYMNDVAAEIMSRLKETQRRLSWEENGLPFVGYLDGVGDTFLFELKTTTDAEPEQVMRDFYNNNYHMQAGMYQAGYRKKFHKYLDHFFLVIEKTEPFGISVLKATKEFIDLGIQEYEYQTAAFKMCMDNDLWHNSYNHHSATGYFQLELPGYAKSKLNK